MAEDKKSEQSEVQSSDKTILEKAKEIVESKLEKLMETGIQVSNIDYFYKLIDIHKDIENEDYWRIKKEVLENDVR